jgi:hypothetical protein
LIAVYYVGRLRAVDDKLTHKRTQLPPSFPAFVQVAKTNKACKTLLSIGGATFNEVRPSIPH